MDAEQIVRALAAADPPYGDPVALSAWEIVHGREQKNRCLLCEADHDPDCPWLLAREWVAANSASRSEA